jgi:tripartite-type tricarboxylate transporter receptor subunit TctC
MRRRSFIAGMVAAPAVASAQSEWPNKQIRIVIPYPPGGPSDITTRLVLERAGAVLGQSVLFDNKAGASGAIGAEHVKNSPADGYTFLTTTTAMVCITQHLQPLPYDPGKDFVAVARTATSWIGMGINPQVPANDLQEFIAYAKANPGKVRYASVGVGSNNHYDTEAFAQWAGIKLHHIPNKGGGGAIANDVLRGDVHVVLVNAASSAGLAKSGMIRVLAVMADQRLPDYPDAPTLKELGYAAGKGLWSALYAPSKTPRDVLETLHRQIVQALNAETVRTTFGKQMIKAIPNPSIADAQDWNKLETAHWKKITEDVKIDRPE